MNVAVVGLGYWGKNLLRTFGALPTARVTGLCDLAREQIARHAEQHPGACGTTDYAELLGRADVDAVALATPPSRHHAMALAALRAGKHVWVEKPLALSTAQGGELVEAARQAARVLFVDETFLYDPLVREMKRIIDRGGLGEVCHLSLERLGMGRIKRDSNVWWNSAPHDLAILLYLSWLHPEKTATVTVVGRERMLAYEGRFEKRGLTLYDYAIDRANGSGDASAAAIIPIRHLAARRLELPAAAEPLALAAEHFIDSIRNGTEPLTSGARSLRVVEVLEAAEHAATRGGRAS